VFTSSALASQQHPVCLFEVLVADVLGPQPQPEPPADFTAASSAQHASVPPGAGPPQQEDGASGRLVVV
jgi:hypothetical protein